MPSFAIIIPCYNEARRLQTPAFIEFANAHDDVQFYFVNDGSYDETGKLLLQIQALAPKTKIISLTKNKGKGEAVRQGMLVALQSSSSFIGYLDADLSTPLEEFYGLHKLAVQKDMEMLLASRIKKIDTHIERSFFRHITGRIIATIIDQKFKLGVYDTQCGAKIFNRRILEKIIQQPFYTKWFFDIEILLRTRKNNPNYKAAEIPLSSWRTVQNSKLSILSFPIILKELVILLNKY